MTLDVDRLAQALPDSLEPFWDRVPIGDMPEGICQRCGHQHMTDEDEGVLFTLMCECGCLQEFEATFNDKRFAEAIAAEYDRLTEVSA